MFLIQAIVICGLIVGYFLVPEGMSVSVMWTCLVIFYCYLAQSLLNPVTIISGLPSFIKIDFLFLLFYYLIFYFPYQQHVLGFADVGISRHLNALFLPKTNVSIIASTIGVAGFVLGYNGVFKTPRGRVEESIKEQNIFRYFPWLVFGCFFLFFMLFFIESWTVLTTGLYAASNLGNSTDNGIYFLVTHFAMLSAASSIFFLRWDKRFSLPVFIGVGICALWSLALLIMGDRGSFFLIAVVIIGGVSFYFKKITIPVFFLSIAAALFIYGVIEQARMTHNRGINTIFDTVVSVLNSDSIMPKLTSFSSTTATSRAAFYAVPSQHDYFYGKFLLIGVSGIIPYSRKLFVDPNDPILSSTSIITNTILGPQPTYSLGTNIISSIYMDFGIIGVLPIMYMVGFFGRYVTNQAIVNYQSFKWSTVYLISLALYSEAPRFAINFPVRNIAWVFVMFWFYKFILARSNRPQP